MTCKDCVFHDLCVAAGYGDDEANNAEQCCRGFRQVESAATTASVVTEEG